MKLTESALRKIVKQELRKVLNENEPTSGWDKTMTGLAAKVASSAQTPTIELPRVLNEIVKTIVQYGIDLKEIPYSYDILSEIDSITKELIGLGRKMLDSKLYIDRAGNHNYLIYSFEFKNEIGNQGSGKYKLYIPFIPIKAPNEWVSLEEENLPFINPPNSQGVEMEPQDWRNLISIYNSYKQ